MYDNHKVWIIPDKSREMYFKMIDNLKAKTGINKDNDETVWNTYNDPIIIVDMGHFNKQWANYVLNYMNIMEAEDITEKYFESLTK
jgi:hypothetical protein